MEEFFTQDIANEGIELPLYTPQGKKSKHWVRILGVDSDVFRSADIKAKREAVIISKIEDDNKQIEAFKLSQTKLISALIVDWSFDKPCTEEEKIRFLTKAPQLEDAINKMSGSRSTFFAMRSQDSANGTK